MAIPIRDDNNSKTFLLCDIYMHFIRERLFSLYKFSFWCMYFNNAFILIFSDPDLSDLLFLVNNVDPCVQITLEVENTRANFH